MKRMKPDPNQPDLTCRNGHLWPPIHTKVYGLDPESSRGLVSSPEYERLRYWATACGLLQMNGQSKCLACPHALLNGVELNPGAPRHKAAPSNRNVPKR